jgi:hypothetical protein
MNKDSEIYMQAPIRFVQLKPFVNNQLRCKLMYN